MKPFLTAAAISITLLAAGCSSDSTPTPQVVASVAASPTTAPAASGAVTALSLFSGEFTPLSTTVQLNPNWGGQTTVVTEETVDGNQVLKLSNLNYAGIEFGAAVDVSSMNALHIDYWTADSSELQVFAVSETFNGSVEKPHNVTVTTGSWQSIDIPLSDYTGTDGVDLTKVFQLKFAGNGTVFLDNIYFHDIDATTKTLGVYSETSQTDNVADPLVFTSNDWSSPLDVSINASSAGVTAQDGSNSIEVEWNAFTVGDGQWGGAFIDLAPADGSAGVDVSSYANVVFSVNTSKISSPVDVQVKLESKPAGAAVTYLSQYASTAVTSGDWTTYKMPLSDFAGVTLSNLKFIGFLNLETTQATGVPNASGIVHFDNIYFEGSTSPSVVAPVTAVDYLYTSDSSATPKWIADTDFSYAAWDTQNAGDGIFDGGFADTDYNPVWKVKAGSGGWGSALAMVYTASGFSADYANLSFKVKLEGSTTELKVKFPGGSPEEVTYDVASLGTALSNGWYQMEIALSDFGNAAVASEFAIHTAADSTMFLTDIGFSGEAAVTTPPVASVSGDFLYTSDSSVTPTWIADTDFSYAAWDTQNAGDGTFDGGFVDADYNPAWKVKAASGGWGSALAMVYPAAGFAGEYGNVIFKVKLEGTTELKVKFPGSSPEEVTYNIAAVGTALGNDWYQMEIALADFGDVSSASEFAVHTAPTNTMYLTDIGFNGVTTVTPAPALPEPTASAPTPAQAAASVTSVFSDYYTSVPLNAFPTDWSDGGATDFIIPGTSDTVKKLTSPNGVGIEVTTVIDASTYTSISADVWVPSMPAGAVINVFARDFGSNGVWDENGDDSDVLLQSSPNSITEGSWFTISAPLSALATQGAIGQIKFGNASAVGAYTMYLDNIRLH